MIVDLVAARAAHAGARVFRCLEVWALDRLLVTAKARLIGASGVLGSSDGEPVDVALLRVGDMRAGGSVAVLAAGSVAILGVGDVVAVPQRVEIGQHRPVAGRAAAKTAADV